MQLLYRSRGAVSVFLVIVLVPMLLASSLFVDASRVKLSESVMNSAADLALNTALTDYDTVLKDMYGLFATAQDTTELYNKLEEYYRSSIISAGVSEDEADNVVKGVMQFFNSSEQKETSDLLNISLGSDFEVKKRTDASLAHAAVLERQIVEFMKYRAPINTGLSFVTSIKSLSTLSKQTELVEKRQEYYTEQQSVMESAKAAWKELAAYNQLGFAKDDGYLTNMKKDFETEFEKVYRERTVKTVKDLYNTQDWVKFHGKHYRIENLPFEPNFSYEDDDPGLDVVDEEDDGNDYWSAKEYYIDDFPTFFTSQDKSSLHPIFREPYPYTPKHPPTAADFEKDLNNLYAAYMRWEGLWENSFIEYNDNTYDFQVLIQNNRDKKNIDSPYKRLSDCLYKLYEHYYRARVAMLIAETDNLPVLNQTISYSGKSTSNTVRSCYEALMNQVEMQWGVSEAPPEFTTGINRFKDVTLTLNSYSSKAENAHTADLTETNKALTDVYDTAKEYYEALWQGKIHLDNAKRYLQDIYNSVVDGGKLSTSREDWKNKASDKDLKNSQLATQDLSEIAGLSDYLNAEDVQNLIDRISNISTNLENMRTQVNSVTFYDKHPFDINGYEGLKLLLENNIGADTLEKVPVDKTELDAKAKEWSEGKYTVGTPIDIAWEKQSGTQPNLTVDKLPFYDFLYGHFHDAITGEEGSTDTSDEDTQKAEKDIENQKSKYSDSEKDADSNGKTVNLSGGDISTSNEIKNRKNLPSSGHDPNTPSGKKTSGDNAANEASSSLNSMLSSLCAAVVDMGTDLRDKLYVADYILSMFSYDTIEKEYMIKNNTSSPDIKSLTLTPINADNNYAYGREVEYIIYGKSNKENLDAASGSIYCIRLAFNLIYAFMSSEIRDGAFAIAVPLSAATLGVIPAPLIQVGLIIGIACAESALDLVALKNGESVPLFKDSGSWRCSASGAIKKATEVVIDKGTDLAVDLLDKTGDQLDDLIDEKSDEIEKAAESTFDKLVTNNAQLALGQLNTLVDQAMFKSKSDPALDMTEYVGAELDKWVAEDTSGGLVHTVKEEAVKVIKNEFLGTFIETYKGAQDAVSGAFTTASEKLDELTKQIRERIKQAVNDGSDKIKEYKDQLKQDLQQSIRNGASDVKKTLSKHVDANFGDGGGNSDGTGLASIIRFSYSDYLRLFLMVGLYTDEEGVIKRTADVIQVNMDKKQGGKDTYLLSKSSVYVELTATVYVEPVMLALPLFADVEGNPATERGWYTLKCNEIKGY